MILFLPMQQELDCINTEGRIVGKIRFDANLNQHVFYQPDQAVELSDSEQAAISARLSGLDAGTFHIPMQDDD
ncbi:MAG TPA: hypothetical protein DEA26_02190 [Oceanospirillales bacterium]|nr:hypothetical protein [Oceanospirillaceae bacterium]HBS41462.1 hypothetical protein [Oceanospirillales bacterium]|tara:strand:- start:2404 stop:2622 length:219 start_codon:yes stop_codon:yes gene_type:complete